MPALTFCRQLLHEFARPCGLVVYSDIRMLLAESFHNAANQGLFHGGINHQFLAGIFSSIRRCAVAAARKPYCEKRHDRHQKPCDAVLFHLNNILSVENPKYMVNPVT